MTLYLIRRFSATSKPVCAGHHSEREWIDLESIPIYTNILFDFVEQVIDGKE
ncbi:MAG: hypothetical protein GY786_00540 [Proteobacteria bacterium]|nr:hypothetical protein [Pseudomonadota bacterium]